MTLADPSPFHRRPLRDPFPAPVFGREVLMLAGAFAVVLFVVSSIVWGIAGVDPIVSAPGKAIGILGDVGLGALITLALRALRAQPLGVKALAGCAMSLAAAPLSGLLDWGIHSWCVWPQPAPFNPQYFAQVVVYTTSELFGWSCLYLALQYSSEVRDRERRLAALREEALSAQMRALHYQVNPHFLFNALNSVAGLIEEDEKISARDMVVGLAGFMRRTLTLDPAADCRLDEEIDLQLAYLEIERTRFSDRMTVDLRIDPAVRDARVPNLLLQPLVENAVKHGIARTPGKVGIRLGAEPAQGGRLTIWIENPRPRPMSGEPPGLGIGLANVASRLAARYGDAATCKVVSPPPGLTRVEIDMPLTR